MNDKNYLYYDEDEAIKYIKENTGIDDEDIIKKILDSELKYMESVDIAAPIWAKEEDPSINKLWSEHLKNYDDLDKGEKKNERMG